MATLDQVIAKAERLARASREMRLQQDAMARSAERLAETGVRLQTFVRKADGVRRITSPEGEVNFRKLGLR